MEMETAEKARGMKGAEGGWTYGSILEPVNYTRYLDPSFSDALQSLINSSKTSFKGLSYSQIEQARRLTGAQIH